MERVGEPLESFDIIYVDGSHTADDVMADAVLSWGLLKEGGIIVFDDYRWNGSFFTGPGSHLPGELLPGMAIDAFIQTHRNYLQILHQKDQAILKKHANPCPNKSMCSPLGQYTYDWKKKTLSRGPDSTPVELSEAERRRLEQILWSRQVKAGGFVLTGRLREDPEVLALLRRLDLGVRSAKP